MVSRVIIHFPQRPSVVCEKEEISVLSYRTGTSSAPKFITVDIKFWRARKRARDLFLYRLIQWKDNSQIMNANLQSFHLYTPS